MLMAHPAVLQDLADRYEELEADARTGLLDPGARQRLRDVAYTLCVSTGTRDVDAALVAARRHLPGARVEDDSLLAEPAVSAGGGRGTRDGEGRRARHGGDHVPRPQIKDEKTYRRLLAEGAGTEKAARIANSAAATSRGTVGRRGGKSGTYERQSKPELYEQARKVGVRGRSSMTKSQLIRALRDR